MLTGTGRRRAAREEEEGEGEDGGEWRVESLEMAAKLGRKLRETLRTCLFFWRVSNYEKVLESRPIGYRFAPDIVTQTQYFGSKLSLEPFLRHIIEFHINTPFSPKHRGIGLKLENN